jgi:uncharacterized membrane protein YphA (DoxX/SURF4 family)
MNTLLWILQIVLAVGFAAAGTLKVVKSRTELVETLGHWVEKFPAPLLKPLGVLEILAAIGLILPPLAGVLPVLTPVAAVGLIVIMVGAVVTHAREGELAKIGMNVGLAAMATAVAWARFGAYAF